MILLIDIPEDKYNIIKGLSSLGIYQYEKGSLGYFMQKAISEGEKIKKEDNDEFRR